MGQFLQRYYNNETIAANDIGAVSYFSNAGVLDLWGLANIEIARSRKNGYWNPEFVDSISRLSAPLKTSLPYFVINTDKITTEQTMR